MPVSAQTERGASRERASTRHVHTTHSSPSFHLACGLTLAILSSKQVLQDWHSDIGSTFYAAPCLGEEHLSVVCPLRRSGSCTFSCSVRLHKKANLFHITKGSILEHQCVGTAGVSRPHTSSVAYLKRVVGRLFSLQWR